MKKIAVIYHLSKDKSFHYEVGGHIFYNDRNLKIKDIMVTNEKVLKLEFEEGGFVCFYGIPFKYFEVPIN